MRNMKTGVFIAMLLVLMTGATATAELVFFDSFEAGMSNWTKWVDVTCPREPPDPSRPCGYGPYAIFQSTNHPRPGGTQCARQEKAQPWWYGSIHVLADLPTDRTVRLSVWQFEDYNKRDPFPPGHPEFNAHDQVQGWAALTGDYVGEMGEAGEWSFNAIGVHAHKNSAPPLADWWHNVSYCTGPVGSPPSHEWVPTSAPRAQGFRRLDIWVHPYTGSDSDVEFFVDGARVGTGPRRLDFEGRVIPINKIGLGTSPAHMDEDYITNTYEFFWYDDVKLTVGALGDLNNDGSIDGADYGLFAGCFNGSGNIVAIPCREADFDNDGDVDGADYGIFAGCFNGTGNPPPTGCL